LSSGICHICFENRHKTTELFRLGPTTAFVLGFTPPLVGAIAAITIALILHNAQISNYNWSCGRAYLPSVSRIINLPLERTFWQTLILFHVPLRILELITGFIRYDRLKNIHYKHNWFYELSRYCYFFIGLLELSSLAALSIVGEREYPILHVIFFYIFGFSGIGFFIANLICHRHSLYYLNPYGRLSYRLKMIFGISYMLTIPALVTAFLLYWRACVTGAYDAFAVFEYIEVLLNIAFHGCTIFDIRDKVVFSVHFLSIKKRLQFIGKKKTVTRKL
uniref:G protein-coupled receptor n=1 Tax=Enterobius vermicularis TaxID=51028 RepID=A0A0N4VIZ6_ENTVE